MSAFLSPRAVVGAALVGIVGAAGLFIYEQLYAEKRRAMLVQEMGRLDRQVASMREELEALRELQKQQTQAKRARPRRARAKPAAAVGGDLVDGGVDVSYASDSEYLTDYQSLAGTDAEMDSEEFYDVHSDSEREESVRSSRRSARTLEADRGDQLVGDSEEHNIANGTKST